jgi:Tol biopolymer transport system component
MWRLASAAVLIAVVILAAASTLTSRADTPTPTPEPTISESPSPSPEPSPSPSPSPEPTPEPLPPPPPTGSNPPPPPGPAIDPSYPGSLRPGDWVEIAGTDSCLNMRYEPKLPVPDPGGAVRDNVMNCLPDGFIGRLDGFNYWSSPSIPVQADGHWWWHISGQGWAAEEFLRFHHKGGLPWPERPEVTGAGLIAYIATDNSVWRMNADGSDPRPIVGSPGQSGNIHTLRWSPDGDRLAYTLNRWDGVANTTVTQVIDVNGTVLHEYPGIAEARWSPGGGPLSAIQIDHLGDMGGYYGRPVVVDVATGASTPVGPLTGIGTSPVWSPDGNSIAYVCFSNYIGQPDGSWAVDPANNCGGDGLRIAAADGSGSYVLLPMDLQSGSYLSNPSWSPSGGPIALLNRQEEGGCRGYTFIDVGSGAVTGCAPLPPAALYIGGRCGGSAEMGASYWTPDGSALLFGAQGTGQSGVFVYRPGTGATTVIPNMNGMSPSSSGDSQNVTFSDRANIWVAGLDGSDLTLLAEGHSPAWQPQS